MNRNRTTRRPSARPLRQFTVLLRDARGRFMRVLPTLAELAAALRPRRPRRPRPPVTAVQLTLF